MPPLPDDLTDPKPFLLKRERVSVKTRALLRFRLGEEDEEGKEPPPPPEPDRHVLLRPKPSPKELT